MKPIIRTSLIALLAANVAGCSSIPDPFGFFETDNQAEPAELTDYEPKIQIGKIWSSDAGTDIESQHLGLIPAFYQDRILVADGDGKVHSMEAEKGKSAWTIETEAPVSGGPGVGEDLVVLGTRDAHVIALEESDGTERWRAQVSSEVLAVPQISEGVVVVRTIDGRVYGLNEENGEQLWVYESSVPVLTLRGSSSPVIYEGTAIIGFSNGKLVSLAVSSGDPQWETTITPPRGRTELERIVDIDADPVISDNIAYVATYQGEVAAVSVESGVVLWRRELSSYAGVDADWRHVYVTDSKDQVWALDPQDGSALWKQDKLLNRRLTAPAILEDYVLVGDLDGYVHWLSYEDGAQLARVRVSSAPISAPPHIEDGIAYVFADDGTVAALAPAQVIEP